MVKALLTEIKDEKDYLGGEPVQTIYFGGGTPSLLDNAECSRLLESVRRHYPVADDVEITLEANPDDITSEKLKLWRDTGINRLSIGVQSFFEEELKWMNRAHNAVQSNQCITLSHENGFHNLSIDLIYGSPLQTDEMWKENVSQAVELGIPHLSCYALTVEERTPLHKMITNRNTPALEDDKQARHFLQLMQWLRMNGYDHYEVSNFARPGFRSRHNSSYWKGEKYLGIGPSAHSYNGEERRWNAANNPLYISGINEQSPRRESELLTPVQALNEFIMISLRTSEGLDLEQLERRWGFEKRKKALRELQKFNGSGLVRFQKNQVQLTDKGMLRADGIASELFS